MPGEAECLPDQPAGRLSESGVRVSLTVSTAQRTESGASARWASTPPAADLGAER